jgi:hypothetical protein
VVRRETTEKPPTEYQMAKDISIDGPELSEAELQDVAGGGKGAKYATNNTNRSNSFFYEDEKTQKEMDVDESIAPILD